MSKDLFSDLLYIDTFQKDNRVEAKFKQLLPQIEKEFRESTPLYEIDFPKKAYSYKLKYYEKLIERETALYFNEMIVDLDRTSIDEHLRFLYQKWHNRLISNLSNINEYINKHDLIERAFKVPGATAESDHVHAIFYLKANAILLFLELQSRFSKHGDEPILSQEELHEVYFFEAPPEDLYVTEFSGKPIIKPQASKNIAGKFNAIKSDLEFRPDNNNILTYPELIKSSKADAFARYEERLVNEGILYDDYSFNSKRGNKQVLGAFLLRLFENGYFNERYFPDKKPSKRIERKHITKFFAHRYGHNSNADKEYRNFEGAKRNIYEKLFLKNPWLDQIS
jgi:hypothetical protein